MEKRHLKDTNEIRRCGWLMRCRKKIEVNDEKQEKKIEECQNVIFRREKTDIDTARKKRRK